MWLVAASSVKFTLSRAQCLGIVVFPIDDLLDRRGDFLLHLFVDFVRPAERVPHIVVRRITTLQTSGAKRQWDHSGPVIWNRTTPGNLNLQQDSGKFAERKHHAQQGWPELHDAANLGLHKCQDKVLRTQISRLSCRAAKTSAEAPNTCTKPEMWDSMSEPTRAPGSAPRMATVTSSAGTITPPAAAVMRTLPRAGLCRFPAARNRARVPARDEEEGGEHAVGRPDAQGQVQMHGFWPDVEVAEFEVAASLGKLLDQLLGAALTLPTRLPGAPRDTFTPGRGQAVSQRRRQH